MHNRRIDEAIRETKGELPECPCFNLKTLEIEYIDPNEESINWDNYKPLSDLYA